MKLSFPKGLDSGTAAEYTASDLNSERVTIPEFKTPVEDHEEG